MNAASTVDLLREVAQRVPNQDAYVDQWERMSFGEWDRRAARLAASLQQLGVAPGDVVCARLPSSARFAVLYQATMRLGAILSPINPRLGQRETAHILRSSEPRVFITDASEEVAGLVSVGLLELEARSDTELTNPASIDENTPVSLVWTSGTTGLPKGALFSHRQLKATAEGMRPFLRQNDRQLTPYPLSQIAYATRVWGEIEHAVTNVVTPPRWDPEQALRLLREERLTIGQGVVTHWVRMLRVLDDSVGLPHLRLAVIGGFAFPPELAREIRERLGCDLVNRYGSTEASGVTSTLPGDPDEAVARTVGQPCRGVEIEVRDQTGAVVETGTPGTVHCRSGAVMSGYWRAEDATREVVSPDGWLDTGDVGLIDSNGRLVIQGRSNESYIRGGFTIHPGEIEKVLAENTSVARAAVVPVADLELGSLTVALVEKSGSVPPGLHALRDWVSGTLARYKAPDRLVVVDRLPTNDLGKIDKKRLRSVVDDLGARTADPDFGAIAAAAIADLVEPHPLDLTSEGGTE